MADFNIHIEAGKAIRINTAGKFCEGNIVVEATGGGASDAVLIVHSLVEDNGTLTRANFKSITIGEGITRISDNAFDGCSSLTSIDIPDGVTEIGYFAFNGCSALTSIDIPDGVTEIGYGAFGGCSALTSLPIHDNITMISDWAFCGCDSLINITIPDSVTSIGEYALSSCAALSSVTFKGTPTSISGNVFDYCDNLTTINVPWAEGEVSGAPWGAVNATIFYAAPKPSEGLEYTLNEDGASYSVSGIGACTDTDVIIPSTYEDKPVTEISDGAFQECSSLTSVVIPDSITSIGGGAFFHCTSLTSVVIPDSVTSIREWALAYCSSLTSINIPDSVTSIIDNAFYRCSSLTSITIPDNVTSIGSKAFYMCSSLKSVTFKGTPTSILTDVFKDCNALTTINVPWAEGEVANAPWGATNATINYNYGKPSEGLEYTLNDDGETYSVSGIGTCTDTDVVIASTYEGKAVTSIGENAFSECGSFTSVTIPDGVTRIENNAFYHCSLNAIVIPCSVKSIGYCAFAECRGLTNVVIPDGVVTIADQAFWYCTSLTSISISASVTSIGENALHWCGSLTNITVDENNPVYHSVGNCLIETGSKTLIAGCNASAIPGDGSVTSIGHRAFADCNSLTSITIPNSVTSIGNEAFAGCTSLTSITIPDSVTSVGLGTFWGCTSLTSISVDENNTVYHSAGNCIIDTATKALVIGCGTSVIPTDGSVMSIWESAFSGCTSLTSITIPNSVTSIGYSAFGGTSLTSITLPDSVTSIDCYAFISCDQLLTINVPWSEGEVPGSPWGAENTTINYNYSEE